MSLINAEVEWHGNDLAEGHTTINGKPYKIVVESED